MHTTHTQSLIDTSKELMENSSDAKITEILHRFENIDDSLVLGSNFIHNQEEVDIKNDILIKFMATFVTLHPYCDSIFIALKNGRYMQVKKLPPKSVFRTIADKYIPKIATLAVRIMQTSKLKKEEIWYYLDSDYHVIASEKTPESEISFDFFTREWWKNAIDTESLQWTSIFVVNSTQLPGIAASYPIRNEHNEVIGAIATDIHIKSFLEILAANAFTGISLIINSNGEVIAHPNVLDTAKTNGQEVKLVSSEILPEKQVYHAYMLHHKTQSDQLIFNHEGIDYIARFIPFHTDLMKDWIFLSVVPLDFFIGTIKKAQTQIMSISLIILLLSTFLMSFLTLRISRPINDLVKQADRIRVFDLSNISIVQSNILEIQKLQDSIQRMRRSLQAFGKFVPKTLVRSLVEKETEVKIGGKKKRITLMFSDIENFTTISESSSADRLMMHVSEYFDELSQIILREHGTIDKYIGDAIMAFWGAPSADTKHALHACQAALFMQKRLIDLNRKWVYDKKAAFHTRIGIHTGDVIVGNLGSSERMNYTVIGDTVNLASRLEGINKNYGTKLIISEPTFKDIHEHAVVRPLDIVAVKGKKEGIAIYELIALTGTDPYLLPTNDELDMCHLFQKAFKYYYDQRWDDAIDLFQKIALRFPADIPVQMYITRCQNFKKDPPGKDWDHVLHLKEK